MKTKRKGTKNEHRSMQRDVAAGALCLRAGGSLGLFDYIALYPDFVRLVQVKSNRWASGQELATLIAFPAPSYSRKVVERWDDYARSPLVREIP